MARDPAAREPGTSISGIYFLLIEFQQENSESSTAQPWTCLQTILPSHYKEASSGDFETLSLVYRKSIYPGTTDKQWKQRMRRKLSVHQQWLLQMISTSWQKMNDLTGVCWIAVITFSPIQCWIVLITFSPIQSQEWNTGGTWVRIREEAWSQ